MDGAISKMLFIGAAVAIAAVVIATAWNSLGSSSDDSKAGLEYSTLRSQVLCEAAGGTWDTACTGPS